MQINSCPNFLYRYSTSRSNSNAFKSISRSLWPTTLKNLVLVWCMYKDKKSSFSMPAFFCFFDNIGFVLPFP